MRAPTHSFTEIPGKKRIRINTISLLNNILNRVLSRTTTRTRAWQQTWSGPYVTSSDVPQW